MYYKETSGCCTFYIPIITETLSRQWVLWVETPWLMWREGDAFRLRFSSLRTRSPTAWQPQDHARLKWHAVHVLVTFPAMYASSSLPSDWLEGLPTVICLEALGCIQRIGYVWVIGHSEKWRWMAKQAAVLLFSSTQSICYCASNNEALVPSRTKSTTTKWAAHCVPRLWGVCLAEFKLLQH